MAVPLARHFAGVSGAAVRAMSTSHGENAEVAHTLAIAGWAADLAAFGVAALQAAAPTRLGKGSVLAESAVEGRGWWKTPDECAPVAVAASQPLGEGGVVIALGDAKGGVCTLRLGMPTDGDAQSCVARFGDDGDPVEPTLKFHFPQNDGVHGRARVLALAVAPDGGVLASGDSDGRVVLSQPHDASAARVLAQGNDGAEPVTALDTVSGAASVVAVGRTCAPFTLDARVARPGAPPAVVCGPAPDALRPGHAGPRRVMSPDGRPELVLLGGGHGVVLAWDVRMAGKGPTAASFGAVPHGGGSVTDLALDPAPGQYAASTGVPACLASCAGGALTRAVPVPEGVVRDRVDGGAADAALIVEPLPLASVCAEAGRGGAAFALAGECLAWVDTVVESGREMIA